MVWQKVAARLRKEQRMGSRTERAKNGLKKGKPTTEQGPALEKSKL